MIIDIPDRHTLDIKHIIFDYNGTIALDGKVIEGVIEKINHFSAVMNFHVVTADTYGTAERELEGVNCQVVNLSKSENYKTKTDYLAYLGKENTLSVGNGFNDSDLLKQSIVGIALIQDEGLCMDALMSADIVCKSVMDVFSYIEKPNRLKATLRV
ncbi:MAG: ATPase P [Pseudomonadota bacterium]|nr:ATPase P [Pseudomonadota bacterium]